MKFSTIVALTVLGGSTTVLAVDPPANDECWNPIQITCNHTYHGSNIAATFDNYVGYDCFDGLSNRFGVWYKLSTGGNTFQLKLDTCYNADGTMPASDYDSYISVYRGPCNLLSHDLQSGQCVAGNDDNRPACTYASLVGPASPSGDEDYWIFVHGFDHPAYTPQYPTYPGGFGNFNLTVRCDPVIGQPFHEAPLGNIDPWYIQRSAYPAPDVTNVDPLMGGTWLELHENRVVGSAVPKLNATVHALPTGGQRCNKGPLIMGATFNAIPCDPAAVPPPDPPCPELMNGPDSVAVLQNFTITDPYNPSKSMWIETGLNDGQLQFCVHTFLQLDYDADPTDEEVSYFDTYYVVEVDFTSGFRMQNVAALERNPGDIDKLFDDWIVTPYLCADGNEPGILINTEIPIDESHDYFVGENFRICITPKATFGNFAVKSFNNVTCSNTNSNENNNRAVIVLGTVPSEEQGLTVIDDSSDAPPKGIAFESTVTSGFLAPGQSLQYFDCYGTVEMEPIGLPSSRRILQDGENEAFALLPEDENLRGSFKVTLRVVNPEPDGLSTGAIVGISMAAFAVFLVVFIVALLILYRRGCFDKKTNSKHPKTVSIPEEDSETSGENAA